MKLETFGKGGHVEASRDVCCWMLLVYITLKRHPDDATSTTVASSPEVQSLRAVMSISQSIKPGKFFLELV